jgi:hypothetical protein
MTFEPQKVYSLAFKIKDEVLTKDDFDLSQLEFIIDEVFDKTEAIDEDLDIDISIRDMYIMTNKIDDVLPLIKEIMDKTQLFDENEYYLSEVETPNYNT